MSLQPAFQFEPKQVPVCRIYYIKSGLTTPVIIATIYITFEYGQLTVPEGYVFWAYSNSPSTIYLCLVPGIRVSPQFKNSALCARNMSPRG
jgi:hypothetical protein